MRGKALKAYNILLFPHPIKWEEDESHKCEGKMLLKSMKWAF